MKRVKDIIKNATTLKEQVAGGQSGAGVEPKVMSKAILHIKGYQPG